ncbi:hypothetical protein [Kutzneria buriramensis]|uniref:Uncharacterized protein n=1 Tax=Kutzneria buriramensis TaxID=1045776 RepID=A0A3E0HFR6_9PSEU|nr:hypothetical protein [Kutzneria buriramensis]REH43645.1 hypothetical protein BCF44_109188 [Kutzneria buriramensis]
MRLRYLGDPGRHYPDLGLLAYPDDVRELADDPGDGRWVEVDPDTPLTERLACEPATAPVDEHQADAQLVDKGQAPAGSVVEPAGAAGAAQAGVVDGQSTSEQANTRGARRSGKETT